MHWDSLWQKDNTLEAVWCFGECFPGKPWVLSSMWMSSWCFMVSLSGDCRDQVYTLDCFFFFYLHSWGVLENAVLFFRRPLPWGSVLWLKECAWTTMLMCWRNSHMTPETSQQSFALNLIHFICQQFWYSSIVSVYIKAASCTSILLEVILSKLQLPTDDPQ